MSKSLSDYVAKTETRRYLLDTAVSLKKGDFNTPPVIRFFQKENGGFDLCYSKPPLSVCNRTHTNSSSLVLPLNQQSYSASSRQKERADNRIFDLRVIGSASVRLAL